MEVAAAGSHNIMMTSSPGAGKTLLARSLEGSQPVILDLFGQRFAGLESAAILTGPGPFAMNTLEKSDLDRQPAF